MASSQGTDVENTGTAKDDTLEEKEDDLPTVEYDEMEIRRVHIDVEPSIETIVTPEKKETKTFHYVKVGFLFLIWCIYAIALITHEEDIEQSVLLSIPPKQEKRFELDVQENTKDAIEIRVKGPFNLLQDVERLPKKEEPQLELKVLMEWEGKTKTITKTWGLLIIDPENLEYVRAVSQHIRVPLNEDVSDYNKQKLKLFLSMTTNIKMDLTIILTTKMALVDQFLGIIFGSFVLIFLYVVIIWEFINRTLASFIACTLAIGILAALDARPSTELILSWLDVETLMLLFGMMILVAILSESGIFDYLAVLAYELARGELVHLIYVLCFFTSFLSAFLDNVTMMLLMTPVTIRLCEVTNLNPVPVLMSMVIYSNVGAALTPVGDPPNIIIMNNNYVNNHGVNFGNFITHMLPGVILGLITTFMFLYIKYPNIKFYMNKQSQEVEALIHEIQVWERAAQSIQPTTTDEEIVQSTLHKKAQTLKQKLKDLENSGVNAEMDYDTILAHMKAAYPIRNMVLLVKASFSFTFVLILFFLHTVPDFHHLSLGWSALVGAILILILAGNNDMEGILSRLEWSTLLFFACLFILMEALTELGLIGALGQVCVKLILKASPNNRLLIAILIILWVSGVASAFLDNIPVTTMMVKIVVNLCQNKELNLPLPPLVWALAFGACFGGNGTLIGASANVVSSGVAQQHGYPFSFIDFFKFGFPIMLATLFAVSVYLYFAHCFWTWH